MPEKTTQPRKQTTEEELEKPRKRITEEELEKYIIKDIKNNEIVSVYDIYSNQGDSNFYL